MTANAQGYTFVITAQPKQDATAAHIARTAHDDWRINAEGSVFRARLAGHVVWATRLLRGAHPTIYVTWEQASALGLCPFHGCGKAATHVGFEGLRCNQHQKFGMSLLCATPGCTQVSEGGFSYACKAHGRPVVVSK